MRKENFVITGKDEWLAIQYIVQIMYEHKIISDTERKKILEEYLLEKCL